MKSILLCMATAFFFTLPNIHFAQAPNLGAATGFAIFKGAGAFTNAGTANITGDAGTANVNGLTGLTQAEVTGQIHVGDTKATQAATATNTAYTNLASRTCDSVIRVGLGNGQVLTPKTYCIGALSTLNGDLTLDAKGNTGAIFIIKIDGAFSTSVGARVLLANGTSLCNVYWQVNGTFILESGTEFKGTALVNGAVSLLGNAGVQGRVLATVGAISTFDNTIVISATPVASTIVAHSATSFCANSSVTLSGNIGGVWNHGSVSPTTAVNTSGSYFVTNSTATCSVKSNVVVVMATPLPSDYGDLLTTSWPVAFAKEPSCAFTGNEASPFDPITNPYVVVWAGAGMSSETSTNSGGNQTATTDNFDDGLTVPVTPLNGGYTYAFTVTVKTNTTATTNAYYRLWFDWNNDGDFSNDLDGNGNAATYAGTLVSTGVASAAVLVKPPFVFSTNYKVRLVVTDINNTTEGSIPDFYRNGAGGAPTPNAIISMSNGEVEDYNAPAVILPVTFGAIEAVANKCNVYLSFNYGVQLNNNRFEIEHSINGTTWKQLSITGNTGNAGEQKYTYLHTNPASGSNYYRIKQVDNDGQFSYSKIVMTQSACAGTERIVLYPNPVYSNLTIILPAISGKAAFRITDATGKLIMNMPAKAFMNTVPTENLLRGMYIISVYEGGKIIYNSKFVKE